MQPVSMLMSNMNVEAMTSHAPNALAAAQDTGKTQEIIREGIRVTQRVQAGEEAANAQRVHRKNDGDSQQKRDSYEQSQPKKHEESKNEPVMRETARTKKRVDFLA